MVSSYDPSFSMHVLALSQQQISHRIIDLTKEVNKMLLTKIILYCVNFTQTQFFYLVTCISHLLRDKAKTGLSRGWHAT